MDKTHISVHIIKMKKEQIQLEHIWIIQILATFIKPVSFSNIKEAIKKNTIKTIENKTLQRRLKNLVESGLVIAEGEKRNRKYSIPRNGVQEPKNEFTINMDKDTQHQPQKELPEKQHKDKSHPIYSPEALSLLEFLDTPSFGRPKSTYQLTLVENYIPNKTQYVPSSVREKLEALGKRFDTNLTAGTYAKHIGQRLLIDLSYNSSRLEGNTYSKLDTQNLIEKGLSAEGKIQEETVMIINHKEAIQFLVEHAEETTLTPFTIRNIHFLLSQDLLKNPNSCGNIRQVEVGINKSAYIPLNNPHQLEECLSLLLRKAAQIDNPFEQSFFYLSICLIFKHLRM